MCRSGDPSDTLVCSESAGLRIQIWFHHSALYLMSLSGVPFLPLCLSYRSHMQYPLEAGPPLETISAKRALLAS